MNAAFDLLFDREIYARVVRDAIANARQSVFIATALVKQTTVELGRGGHGPFLRLVEELLRRGVRVALLMAGTPTRPFVESLREAPRAQAAMAIRLCARNHMKLALVDNRRLYAGSANLTGAGLGHKAPARRNFEFGLHTTDAQLLGKFSRVAE